MNQEERVKKAIAKLEEAYIMGTTVLIMDKASGMMVTIEPEAIPFFREGLK